MPDIPDNSELPTLRDFLIALGMAIGLTIVVMSIVALILGVIAYRLGLTWP